MPPVISVDGFSWHEQASTCLLIVDRLVLAEQAPGQPLGGQKVTFACTSTETRS
jgi:hypothetical protein